MFEFLSSSQHILKYKPEVLKCSFGHLKNSSFQGLTKFVWVISCFHLLKDLD